MAFYDIYTDPDLVELYDDLNPWRQDFDFYLGLPKQPSKIIDLGCGTGLLVCAFAKRGHSVTGVDPANSMIEKAKQASGANMVSWVAGFAGDIAPSTSFDIA